MPKDMIMVGPEDINAFWLDEIGPDGWYDSSEELDARIRDQFEETWNAACDGKFSLWLTYPSGALAYIILMDQFSRNMFRGTGKAFASDAAALAAAKSSIERGWDLRIDEPARQFFYMPLMHSRKPLRSGPLRAPDVRTDAGKPGKQPAPRSRPPRGHSPVRALSATAMTHWHGTIHQAKRTLSPTAAMARR